MRLLMIPNCATRRHKDHQGQGQVVVQFERRRRSLISALVSLKNFALNPEQFAECNSCSGYLATDNSDSRSSAILLLYQAHTFSKLTIPRAARLIGLFMPILANSTKDGPAFA